MELTYQICAVVGGTVIVCQFLLTLIGLGGDHGADHGGGHDVGGHDVVHDATHHGADGHHDQQGHGHSANWFFGLLTFRTVVAFFAFFGLTGLILLKSGMQDEIAFAGALAAGTAALVLIGWLMQSLSRLNVDGTLRIERTVGAAGTVYLTIPAHRGGAGKVHIAVHGRIAEFKAVTGQEALPTGARIVVVSVYGPDTIEVAPAPVAEEVSQ